jgi:hypothetical protein
MILALVILAIVVFLVPWATVITNHVIDLEKRTAWICEERSSTIQLSSPDGSPPTPLKVVPKGCP